MKKFKVKKPGKQASAHSFYAGKVTPESAAGYDFMSKRHLDYLYDNYAQQITLDFFDGTVEYTYARGRSFVGGKLTEGNAVAIIHRLSTADYMQDQPELVGWAITLLKNALEYVQGKTVKVAGEPLVKRTAFVLIIPEFADCMGTVKKPTESQIDRVVNTAACLLQNEMKPFDRTWTNGKFADERLNVVLPTLNR